VIDRARSELSMVNAGHPSAVIARSDGTVCEIESTGPMLSPAFADELWEEVRVEFRPGDDVVVYTDGLTELSAGGDADHDPAKMFGRARMLEAIRAAREAAPDGGASLIDSILNTVSSFARGRPHGDDLTLLTARTL
jgi:sigma-B regulation protein RsbU (phosphoserine phosphatase)